MRVDTLKRLGFLVGTFAAFVVLLLVMDNSHQSFSTSHSSSSRNRSSVEPPNSTTAFASPTAAGVPPRTARRETVVGRLLDVLEATQPSEAVGKYLRLHANERAKLGRNEAGARALIFMCDNRKDCLGTGNRLHGVVDAFVLAMLSSRAFFIVWNRGGEDITKYLQPSEHLDWRLPKGYRRDSRANKGTSPTTTSLDTWFIQKQAEFLFNSDLVANYSSFDVLEMRAILMYAADLMESPYLQKHANEAGLAELIDRNRDGTLVQLLLTLLIRPAPQVTQALAKFDERLRGVTGLDDLSTIHLIGLQIRTGGDGNWRDAKRVPLDAVTTFSGSAISFARNATARLGHLVVPVVFIASDSTKAIDIASSDLVNNSILWTTVEGLVGSIGHVETSKANGAAKSAIHLRAWTDFFTMASVDNAVHGRSSFSEMSLVMGCRPSVYYKDLHQLQGNNMSLPPYHLDHGYCDYWAQKIQGQNRFHLRNRA